MFSNQPQSIICLKNNLQLAKLHNHRAVLVLSDVTEQYFSEICDELKRLGEEDDHLQSDLDQHSGNQRPLDILHLPSRHNNSDNSDHINALLGSEYKCVIFDACGVFNERLFAACTGTILGGGILLLRTPSLKCWAEMANQSKPSYFINRFIRKILSHQTGVLGERTASTEQPETTTILIADTDTRTSVQASTPNWMAEQEILVSQLLAALLDSHQTTAVVQADRGRGKSTLIGRALNKFLMDTNGAKKTITLTSNRFSACKVLLQHAAGSRSGEYDGPIRFVSIEQALSIQHDVLVVEEAGSISIPVLTQLTALSNDIVFATTVQGYEGAGRGFALRFSKQLNQLRPDWLMLNPQQPIRWSNNDPLEAFVNDTLLLKTTLPAVAKPDELISANTQLSQIDKHTLSTDDSLLEEIYSLLVQAHYQTTPSDLRNMLDQEQMLIFTQRCNNVLTGAALVALEGEISADLHEAIVQKKRRLTDQILPQLLAQSAAESNVLSYRYARVVRIAVHPALHRQGFGTNLFKQLHEQLARDTINIGASFGADEQTLSFWLKLGLTPIHYGYKANPRSGLRSACLAIAQNSSVAQTIKKASNILHKNLSVLDSQSNQLDPIRQLLISSTAQSDADLADADLSDAEVFRLITDFCQSKRSFIDTVGFIHLATDTKQSSHPAMVGVKHPNTVGSIHPTAKISNHSDTAALNQTGTIEQHFNTLLQGDSAYTPPKQRRIAEQAVRQYIAKTMLP